MNFEKIPWLRITQIAPVAALLFWIWLVWAFVVRLDYWSAPPFVMIIYGALLSTIVGTVAGVQLAKKGEKIPAIASILSVLLWLLAVVAVLWFWVPPFRIVIGWALRQVSMARFH